MKNEIYVAEYSYRQDAYHIETLEEALNTNKKSMYETDGDWNDYMMFAMGSQEDCAREISKMMVYRNELYEVNNCPQEDLTIEGDINER